MSKDESKAEVAYLMEQQHKEGGSEIDLTDLTKILQSGMRALDDYVAIAPPEDLAKLQKEINDM